MVICEDAPLEVHTPTGPMNCAVYRPVAAGKYPGILFFSEIFQITGPIRRFAQVLAGHGYVVAIPEIFHELLPAGTVLAYDKPGTDSGNACKVGKPASAYDDDARAAFAALKVHPACTGALATVGICIGGHLAYRAAMNEGVKAGVCFYATDIHKGSLGSGGDDSMARTLRGELEAEMLMIWGRQDPHIPQEGRRAVYDAMTAAEKVERGAADRPAGRSPWGGFSWLEFNAAHAFMRDEGARYNPELARVCFEVMFQFLTRKMGEGDRGGVVVQ